MRVRCTRILNCLYSLHRKSLELDEASVQCRNGGDHLFKELVDLAVGGHVVRLETDGETGFG